MEFLVQLFRALANGSRIRILRLLAVLGEMNVSDIARAAGLRANAVSAHLRVLAAAGLVWRRRSGARVAYRLAESAGHPVTARTVSALRRVFGTIATTDPQQVAAADQERSPTRSDAALFACFTAFTHPRRLQIIRHLARHRTALLGELMAQLSMSLPACLRHLDKLERRGVVGRARPRKRDGYALRSGRGRVQKELLRAVREDLVGESTGRRTS